MRLICNSQLDPQDVATAQKAAQAAMRREWCGTEPERLPEPARPRFRRLYDFLVNGKLRVKVIPDAHFGLIHGKAGVITLADGHRSSFLSSVNESLTAWRLNYELLWEDDDPKTVDWVQEEFDALWHSPFAVNLAEAVVQDIGRLAVEIGIYAGDQRSWIMHNGVFTSAPRDLIKERVRKGEIRVLIGTDPASEGLNLQRLGTLINLDLPWNPSRLEQRNGRIQRIGQLRDTVDLYNLRYAGSVEDRVHELLSERLEHIANLFGQIPDILEDLWIDLALREVDAAKKTIDAVPKQHPFQLRYHTGQALEAGQVHRAQLAVGRDNRRQSCRTHEPASDPGATGPERPSPCLERKTAGIAAPVTSWPVCW